MDVFMEVAKGSQGGTTKETQRERERNTSWKITLSWFYLFHEIERIGQAQLIHPDKKGNTTNKKLHIIDHICFASIDFDFEAKVNLINIPH